ncbi:MAG TPA: maleylpyruvate isomerase family mycothiol-dependent enzyme [Acidimicrobiia bacterium]
MHLSRRVELIELDSAALAAAAEQDLAAPIPSCPGWTMADLVRHVLQVHRSWCLIVEEGRTTPDWSQAPMPPDAELVAEFRANAERFAEVLGATDPETPCWTWGPEQNAGFVQRFQVQEAALHRWDAESAVGTPGPIAPDGAADAIALDHLLLAAAAPSARAGFEVVTTDTPFGMTISATPDLPVVGSLRGTASDLLLVLWKRLPLSSVDVTGDAGAIAAAIAAIDID